MQQANRGSVRGYFMAGWSMNWGALEGSLLVSSIGSEHFIGLAGFSVAALEFNTTVASVAVYIQCWSLHHDRVPVQTIGRTVPEGVFSALSLMLYISTKLSVNLYSGAFFIQESLGWNLYLSIIPPHHNDSCAESHWRSGCCHLLSPSILDNLWSALSYRDQLYPKWRSWQDKIQKHAGQSKHHFRSSVFTKSDIFCILQTVSQMLNNTLKILQGPNDPDLPWPDVLLGQTLASI